MSIQEELEWLRQVPLFAAVEPAKLKLLAFVGKRLDFRPGQTVMAQGDVGDAAFVIMGGTADVMVDSGTGPIPVAEMGAGAFVGEISVFCDIPRTASVVARTPLRTLKIGKEEILKLVREFPAMGAEMLKVLAERLHATTADLTAARARLKELEAQVAERQRP